MAEKTKVNLVYMAPLECFAFYANVLDKEGNEIDRIDPATKAPIIVNGETVKVQQLHQFQPVLGAAEKKLCRFEVTESTPKYVVKRLAEIHKEGRILTQEEYARKTNSAYDAEQRAEKAEKDRDDALAMAAEAESKYQELQKKFEDANKKK